MSRKTVNERLDRLEQAVLAILRVLKSEERQLQRLEREINPTKTYPKTIGISVKKQ